MENLPNEITNTKQAAFAITFGIFWRLMLVMIFFTIIGSFITFDLKIEYFYIYSTLELVTLFVLFWFIINRVIKNGFGTVKYILMKKDDYNELVKKTETL